MDEPLCLPPGFRFHPTDEEIITHYLLEKIANRSFSSLAIAEANFNDCEPWDLPGKAKMGEKEWFFFCQKDRKYPTGMRTNRATVSGYWKATGKDKEIFEGNKGGMLVGNKKTLVFYKGRAPKGQKTNWVMHEYRLDGKHQQYLHSLSGSPQDEWVVCKVYNKIKDTKLSPELELTGRMNSYVDDFLVDSPTLPPLMDSLVHINSSNKEVVGQQELEHGFSQSIFSSPTQREVHFWNQQGDKIRAPLISSQALYALKVPGKIEQPMNSEASSYFSDQHQISSLHASDGDPSSGLQSLDFDSILKYGFV